MQRRQFMKLVSLATVLAGCRGTVEPSPSLSPTPEQAGFLGRIVVSAGATSPESPKVYSLWEVSASGLAKKLAILGQESYGAASSVAGSNAYCLLSQNNSTATVYQISDEGKVEAQASRDLPPNTERLCYVAGLDLVLGRTQPTEKRWGVSAVLPDNTKSTLEVSFDQEVWGFGCDSAYCLALAKVPQTAGPVSCDLFGLTKEGLSFLSTSDLSAHVKPGQNLFGPLVKQVGERHIASFGVWGQNESDSSVLVCEIKDGKLNFLQSLPGGRQPRFLKFNSSGSFAFQKNADGVLHLYTPEAEKWKALSSKKIFSSSFVALGQDDKTLFTLDDNFQLAYVQLSADGSVSEPKVVTGLPDSSSDTEYSEIVDVL